MRNGLNENSARNNASRGTYSQPGKFFTFEVGPPNALGLGRDLAYEMGFRKCSQPVILYLVLPDPIVSDLLKKKLLIKDDKVVGLERPQFVFSPKAFPVINNYATWQIEDPSRRPPLP